MTRKNTENLGVGSSSDADIKPGRLGRVSKRAKTFGRTVLATACLVGGPVAGVATLNTLAPAKISAGPFEGSVTMSALPLEGGGTHIYTSLGEYDYPLTHDGARVNIEADVRPDFQPKTALGGDNSPESLLNQTEDQLKHNTPGAIKSMMTRTSLAVVGGELAGGLVYLGLISTIEGLSSSEEQRRRISRKFGASYMGAILIASLVPYTIQPILTRNPNFTREVHATGLLATGQHYLDNMETLSEQLQAPVHQFFDLNEVIEALNNNPADKETPDVCVYVVSDPHLGGYRIVHELSSYDRGLTCTRVTIVAGDLVDWGTVAENSSEAVAGLSSLPGKIEVVPGNHDSDNTMKAAALQHNVTVLNDKSITLTPNGGNDLSIFGISDPDFTPDDSKHIDTGPDNYKKGKEIAEKLTPGDIAGIIISHEPKATLGFMENLPKGAKVPFLVVSGHTHQRVTLHTYGGKKTTYVNPGTVSGGGLTLVDPKTGKQTPLSGDTVYLKHESNGWRVIRITQLVENFQGNEKSYSSYALDDSSSPASSIAPQPTLLSQSGS